MCLIWHSALMQKGFAPCLLYILHTHTLTHLYMNGCAVCAVRMSVDNGLQHYGSNATLLSLKRNSC